MEVFLNYLVVSLKFLKNSIRNKSSVAERNEIVFQHENLIRDRNFIQQFLIIVMNYPLNFF